MANPASLDVFGAEIQYFRLEPRYWETIIRRFKDTGLRCVTTYVQWGTHLVGPPDRKHPAGRFDFTGRTDPRLNLMRFLNLVEKHDLLLNFRCGPFCCNEMAYGGYPQWLVCGDPALMVWDHQNRTTQGYWIGKREGSQPSYLHPHYLELVRHWFAAVDPIVAPRVRRADAKGNFRGGFITMMNLDNEISYIVKDSFLDSDYNPVNVAPGGYYHQFLREKYGSAKALANAYGRKLQALEDVQPPRQVPAAVGRDLAWYTDWIEFKTWVMCRYIAVLREMHEAHGIHNSDTFRFMTNFNPHLPEGVPTRMPAFEQAVSSKSGPGVVGYDFYRGAFMSYSGYHSMARVLKLMNASLHYTWSAEFMSGTWNKDLSKTSRVSDDHMRFMARCALAQGCKSIEWFMFHDRDCWGDAPVSSHGHPRPSLAVLQQTPRLLFERIPHWDQLQPRTDVGIVYDLAMHQHTAIGDPSPCADNDQYVGKPTLAGVEAGKASKEYYGLFRLIEQAGVQPGVIDVRHDAQPLSAYPLVFLPGSPVVSRATNTALKRYVQRGGVLVVSGVWPSLDETGRALRFLGLSKPGGKLGKGAVVHCAAWLGQDDAEQESPDSRKVVAHLVRRHVPRPAVRLEAESPVQYVDWAKGGGHALHTQERLLASAVLHESPDGGSCVLFVLNHHAEAARFKLTLGVPAEALLDLDTQERHAVKGGRVTVDVDRKSASIYLLEVKR